MVVERDGLASTGTSPMVHRLSGERGLVEVRMAHH